jgi:hypothetical protein
MLPFWLMLLALALGLKVLELPWHQQPERWAALLAVDVIATVWASRALRDFYPQFALDGAGEALLPSMWRPVIFWALVTAVAVWLVFRGQRSQVRNTTIASALLLQALIIASARGWPAYLVIFWTVLAGLGWLAQIEIPALGRALAPESRTR